MLKLLNTGRFLSKSLSLKSAINTSGFRKSHPLRAALANTVVSKGLDIHSLSAAEQSNTRIFYTFKWYSPSKWQTYHSYYYTLLLMRRQCWFLISGGLNPANFMQFSGKKFAWMETGGCKPDHYGWALNGTSLS